MADKTPEEIEAERAEREAAGRPTTPAEQVQTHEGVKPVEERTVDVQVQTHEGEKPLDPNDQAKADGATEKPADEPSKH